MVLGMPIETSLRGPDARLELVLVRMLRLRSTLLDKYALPYDL